MIKLLFEEKIEMCNTFNCANCKKTFNITPITNINIMNPDDSFCTRRCLMEANPIVRCDYCKKNYRLCEGYRIYDDYFGYCYCSSTCDMLDCV